MHPIEQVIITHFFFSIMLILVFIFITLCFLIYCHNSKNTLDRLFLKDSYLLFNGDSRKGEMLLNRGTSSEINKFKVLEILETIQTGKYFNKQIARLVNKISEHLELPNSNHEFWNNVRDYYKRDCSEREWYMKKEFIWFYLSSSSGLLLSMLCIRFSNHTIVFSQNFIANLLGLVGTVLVFLYGVPRMVDDDGVQTLAVAGPSPEKQNKIQWHKNISSLGLGLIASSFIINLLVQLITN